MKPSEAFAAAVGSAVGTHLAARKLLKGPGLISTLFFLLVSVLILALVPLVGVVTTMYSVNRLTRRIGQVGVYAWTGRDCLGWAIRNKSVYVIAPFVIAGLIGQLYPDSGVAVLTWLFFVPLLVIAVWNGFQMRAGLNKALADEAVLSPAHEERGGLLL